MAHPVKCYYCGKTFDRDKEPAVLIENKRRYAHEACFNITEQRNSQEQNDIIKLEDYIKQLFGYKVLPEAVNRQIRKFISENNYTYNGILKALKYHYEVKRADKEKAFGRIGIVPYVYQDAHNYYYEIWETQERNKAIIETQTQAKELNGKNKIEIPTIEIHIQSPERKPMRTPRKLFTFLDDFEEGGV